MLFRFLSSHKPLTLSIVTCPLSRILFNPPIDVGAVTRQARRDTANDHSMRNTRPPPTDDQPTSSKAAKDGHTRKTANKVTVKAEAPENWMQTIDNIRTVRRLHLAPVDSMGCSQSHLNNDKTIDQRFQILQSLMLSSQTKDPITWAAVQKLRENGMGNVEGILTAKEKDIEDLIYPVGFYRRKAVYLKKAARILKDNYGGDIPASVETLCTLPGVGPKMAHLCMQEAWNVNSGIGVDTHVHRIAARLGWVPSKGIKTPEDTRRALESWLPNSYWKELNQLLVGFGQTVCKPVGPKCTECHNSDICPKIGVDKPRKTPESPKKPQSGLRKKPKMEPKVDGKDSRATPAAAPADISLNPERTQKRAQTRNRGHKKIKVEPKEESIEQADERPAERTTAMSTSTSERRVVKEEEEPMVSIKQERIEEDQTVKGWIPHAKLKVFRGISDPDR